MVNAVHIRRDETTAQRDPAPRAGPNVGMVDIDVALSSTSKSGRSNAGRPEKRATTASLRSHRNHDLQTCGKRTPVRHIDVQIA